MRFSRTYWPQKGSCFVIMPFGKKQLRDGSEFDWDTHYEMAIKPTIEGMNITATRADEIFGAQPLMDRVWRGIQEAEIVVADLTGRSPNVMYEIGLAHVIGKRLLILTMYADDVPVDLSEFVQIRYSIQGVQLLQFTRDLAKNITAARNEPSAEAMLSPLPGGGVERVEASVLSVTPTFATVETKDGRRGFLNAEDYSWTRRHADLSRLLREGQKVDGAFILDSKGQQRYSLAAIEDSPWPRLENEFAVGRTFTSVVEAHPPKIGAFVPIKYGISGLIPESHIPVGASLTEGSQVEVATLRIDVQEREVSLRFVRKVEAPLLAPPLPAWGPYSLGQQFEGHLARLQADRGFVLVTLSDGVTGLMPAAKMTQGLREKLDRGVLREGEGVRVEVVATDAVRRRLTLRDVPETDPSPSEEHTEVV